MQQPEGYAKVDPTWCVPQKVTVRPEAGTQSLEHMPHAGVRGMSFTASGADAEHVTAKCKGNIYVLVYIDDILVAIMNLADINHIKARFTAIFQFRDLGEA